VNSEIHVTVHKATAAAAAAADDDDDSVDVYRATTTRWMQVSLRKKGTWR